MSNVINSNNYVRRINLFGGPGSGKSTIATDIFSHFKRNKSSAMSIELCSEYVKRWAYSNRAVKKHDQIYLFAKQQQMEYAFLSNGVDVIVTDCPCLLSYYYSLGFEDKHLSSAIKSLNQSYDSDFKPLNVFINRGDKPYIQHGRWQTEGQAKKVDSALRDILYSTYGHFEEINYNDKSYLEKIAELL